MYPYFGHIPVHHFKIEGRPGEWFIGCKNCWFQLPVGESAAGFCPACGHKLNNYKIGPEDIVINE